MSHPEGPSEPAGSDDPAYTGEASQHDPSGAQQAADSGAAEPQIFQATDLPDASTGEDTDMAAGNLQAELDAANDQVLRAQAELENYRKRVRRDMEQERLFAASSLITELLEVGDNMQLALQAGAAGGSDGLLQGVQMVAGQLASVLEKHGCAKVEAVGCEFDPNLHEAVSQEPSDEFAQGVCSRETRTGYTLHGRVLRPSQVFVSSGPAGS